MTNSYLVTGAAGFIGVRVAELLLEDGHRVTGLDNLNDAYDVRVKEWRLRRLQDRPGFKLVRMDIRDRDGLRQVFDTSFDAVLNLAARAGVRQSVDDPWVYFETNLTGTLNLLDMCREHEVQKFVQASTSSLYGDNDGQPIDEDARTDTPISPYAASKKAAEAICYTYHHLYGIDITVPRYFTVYGPAGRPDMSMFRFVQWIAEGRPVTLFGDGGSRDYTYVDDIALGTIAALKPVGFEIVNLGSDSPVAIKDVIKMVEASLGKKAIIDKRPRSPADVNATWAAIGKAESLLGWKPRYALGEGLEQLTRWYGDNRSWAKDVVTGC